MLLIIRREMQLAPSTDLRNQLRAIWDRESLHMEEKKQQSASFRQISESELRAMLDDPTLDSSTRLIIEGMLEEKASIHRNRCEQECTAQAGWFGRGKSACIERCLH